MSSPKPLPKRRSTHEFERPDRGGDMIRFEGLDKAFGPKEIYRGLNLSVREGETLTIIGGSGTGKSVLLKCLIGLMHPDAGRVIFQGQDLSRFREEDFLEVRRKVAMVFQGSALFDSLSVGENIAYPLREHFPEMDDDEVRERVAQKLEMVNLKGIEEMRPSALSGGMKRRVGLARAIATDPEVILWDEPTTGLDPISTRMIDELIVSMGERLGCTSIVVTHDMDSAFWVSDRIAMLAKKRIVQAGTVEEMRRSSNPDVRAFLDARSARSNRESKKASE
jgi:phospholipid/cholesterol/gamma-HCH transport system ATP-binding protein